MNLNVGDRLGPYEIAGQLGAGGMGEVYRARDPRLGRDVAIKVLTDRGTDADRVLRFEQEARAVAALSHPNVLAIFDIGTGDVPYLVTEFLDGETLRARLERGPLTVPHTIELALPLLAGLTAAHARGIVHRDLKPDNIFITVEGHLKILDFGLATHVAPLAPADQSATRPQTMRGAILGTLGYMAPEQVRGLEADQRADIFACGAVFYEMLTGRRAFLRDSPADTITAVLSDPPSALAFPPETPPALAASVRRCLEKDAGRRFQTVRELASALEAISSVRPGLAATAMPAAPASIAVLPFSSLSADADNEYFSDGLAEELINALTRLSGLRVASRTSSFRFRGRGADVRAIGRELGVGAILEGSVRRVGNRLRVTAQLTNPEDGYHMWSERYDREMADVFAIQDEIVESIVASLAPALVGEARQAVHRATENLEAYERYLRGRFFWNQRSPAVVGTAIRHFEEAIALDPEYALAYAGLADCYAILRVYGWTPPEHSQPRALEAVTRAMALDPALPEVHFSRALYTMHFEKHWRAARQHFVAAIAASPRMAMFEAYFALFLASEYAHAEARLHLDRALALDAHSSIVHFLAAAATFLMGDFSGAERHSARALELEPGSLGARWPQTVALAAEGRLDEALAAAEQVMARTRAPVYLGVLGMLYGCAGRFADARLVAAELDDRQSCGEYIMPVAKLSVSLGLQDLEGVRVALAACVDGGAAPFAVVATNRWLLDAWRHDETIGQLLERLHDGARP